MTLLNPPSIQIGLMLHIFVELARALALAYTPTALVVVDKELAYPATALDCIVVEEDGVARQPLSPSVANELGVWAAWYSVLALHPLMSLSKSSTICVLPNDPLLCQFQPPVVVLAFDSNKILIPGTVGCVNVPLKLGATITVPVPAEQVPFPPTNEAQAPPTVNLAVPQLNPSLVSFPLLVTNRIASDNAGLFATLPDDRLLELIVPVNVLLAGRVAGNPLAAATVESGAKYNVTVPRALATELPERLKVGEVSKGGDRSEPLKKEAVALRLAPCPCKRSIPVSSVRVIE